VIRWLKDLFAMVREYRQPSAFQVKAVLFDGDEGQTRYLTLPKLMHRLELPDVVARWWGPDEPPEEAKVKLWELQSAYAGVALYHPAQSPKDKQ
jgi:hypothetical protein